jgi:hypothetical protein
MNDGATILLVFLIGMLVGMLVGVFTSTQGRVHHRELIKEGHGYYHAETGEFTLKKMETK